jgi:hypothetical protein
MDWINSFLGKKDSSDIKLEPDGVNEFDKGMDAEAEIKDAPTQEPQIEAIVQEPVAPAARKAKSASRKKTKKKGRKK